MRPVQFMAKLRRKGGRRPRAAAVPSPSGTEQAVRSRLGPGPALTFGRLASTGEPVGLPRSVFFPSTHLSVRGHTGTGKSYFVLSVLLQLLGETRVLVGDPKSELAEMTQLALAAVLSTWPRARAARFLEDDYVLVNPYGDDVQAHLNILTPQTHRGADEQAEDVRRFLATALGDSLSFQMQRPVRQAAHLFLELGRRFGYPLSLLELVRFLAHEPYRLGLLRWCEQDDVRLYFLHEFERAPRASIGAIQVRLDSLLADPRVRRTLAAPGLTDLAQAADKRCAIITLPPGTSTTRSNIFMPIFVAELTRSLLGRAQRGGGASTGTPPLVACIDEWQLGVRDPDGARALSDLLTLARHAAVSLVLANQHEMQLPGDELKESLENVGLQVAFRTSSREAQRFAANLPTDTRSYVARSPGAPTWDQRQETAEEARRRLVTEHTRLPDRQCWLTLKKWGHPAVLLKTLDVDLDGLRRAADKLDPGLRALITGRGSGSSPHELDEVIAARRARMRAVADGTASAPVPVDGPVQVAQRPAPSVPRPPQPSASACSRPVAPTSRVSQPPARPRSPERPRRRRSGALPNIGE